MCSCMQAYMHTYTCVCVGGGGGDEMENKFSWGQFLFYITFYYLYTRNKF